MVCAKAAITDCGSPCHSVAQHISHGRHTPQLFAPLDECPLASVDVIVVGINPHWSDSSGSSASVGRARRDAGTIYWGYHRQLLSKLPSGVHVGGMELVQCGSPDGRPAHPLIDVCRPRFFDRAVEVLRPKILIATGRFVGESLYPLTFAHAQGKQWQGMHRQHAAVDAARFREHECSIVFVTQPSAWVSRQKREAAAEVIARAYLERLNYP